jgi:hypothetical protein
MEPSAPFRGQPITFFATFLNTTNGERQYNWRVRIFSADTQREFFKTELRSIRVGVGSRTIATGNDLVVRGAGGCVSFYAQPYAENPDGSFIPFRSPDGTIVTTGFSACPRP